MWIDPNHTEPSNEKLGINPWPRMFAYPIIAIVGAAIWGLGYLLIA